MQDQADKISAQAMANVMSGDCIRVEISFPETGDREMNYIAGVLVLGRQFHLSNETCARICDYLKNRYVGAARAEKDRLEQEKEFLRKQSFGAVAAGMEKHYQQQVAPYESSASPMQGKTLMEVFGLLKP